VGILLLVVLLLSAGCGPGLVALGGGGSGAWFGLAGGDDKKKSSPPPTVGPNVAPAVIISALVREESPARINYTLIDANADTCSVEVEFRVGGGSFAACLQGAGGDPLTGLTSSASGANHVFRWDFQTDLGPQRTTGIDIRMRANDGVQFGSWFTLSALNIGNDGPEINNVSVIGPSGVLLITFDLADQDSDLGSMNVEWSTDQAQNFTEVDQGIEVLGNPPVNLLSSPSGSPGQFIWKSDIALANYVGEFFLRFTAHDQPTGYSDITPASPVVAGPFTLDNSVNQPPVLQIARAYAGQSYVASVPVDFTLADGESDSAAVVVKYAVNGSSTFFDATLSNQFSQGIAGPFPTTPSPSFFGIFWDALADLQNEAGILSPGVSIQLLLVPVDGQAGNPVLTPSFTVSANSAPSVSAISVLNTFGNVPVVVRLTDESSDPVSIAVEYSTDGISFSGLNQSDFVFGSLSALVSSPSGEDSVLVWDSAAVLGGANEPSVYLRITPTDHPASAAPTPAPLMDLTGVAFTSSGFPIINNPAGATPVSVDFYSVATAGGTTATVPQHTTVVPGGASPTNERYFNRAINPTSAIGYNTFYAVFEGPGYGTLLDHLGSPLNYPTATLTMAGPGVINTGDTITIGDGFNTPIVFEFYNGGVQVFPNPNTIVDITSATTADDVALLFHNELVASFGSVFLLQTTVAADLVTLTHYIACNSGNSTSNGGAAPNLAFSNAAVVTGFTELQGGAAPTNGVIYVAPATAPGGSNFVTLKCEIDDPAFFNVKAFRVLFWGQQPTGVNITPPMPSVLINGQQQFTATVSSTPSGAPQFVNWEVVGSGNGTIDSAGLYRAPSVMPAVSQVTIRAVSVLPSVFGMATVNLVPEPTGVNVTSAGGVTTLALSSGTASTLQMTASVIPGTAPQTVTWRIRHSGTDQGPGNSAVGTVSGSGLYTAPNTLPSPDTIQIEAVSTAKTSVFGQFNLTLQAPAPTSFDVTPSTAVVFAGGAGQQFNTQSFVPTNANQAVTWEVIPSTGHGTVSPTGFYTPPPTIAATTPVTVRAKSSVNQAVLDDAIVTLNPNVASIPTSVTITPTEGLATTQSGLVIFSATVAPGTASQSVTWNVVSGPGTIDGSGRYTPNAASTVDYVSIVRATSTVSPFPFAEVPVRVSGSGKDLREIDNLPIARADHTGVWDATNDRLWWVGGVSENSNPDADLNVLWYHLGTNTFGSGPSLGNTVTFTSAPKSIMSAIDPGAKKLYAFCHMGLGQAIRVLTLNLNPIGSTWTEISIGGGGDVPSLVSSLRYPLWFDTSNAIFHMLVGNNNVYRFSPGGSWLSKLSISQVSQGPNSPLNNAWSWDQSNRIVWFVGPSDATSGASNKLAILDMLNNRWQARTSVGQPSAGQASGSMYFHQGKLWMFGGKNVLTNVVHNELWEIDTTVFPAAWNQHTVSNPWPMPRTRGAFALTSVGNDPILFGGGNDTGAFGDMWTFSESAKTFTRANPDEIRPQGRSNAAAVWAGGVGIAYGGLCDHGISNELWSFTFTSTPVRLNWTQMTPGGAAPPPLQEAAMLYDANSNSVLMYGGTTGTGAVKGTGAVGSLYRLNLSSVPATWTLLTPGGTAPAPRFGAGTCFSFNGTAIRSMWMFGGENSGSKFSDIWELDLSSGFPGTWFNRSVGGGPDAREGAAIGWDSRRNRVLLVGGKNAAGPNHQYWEFDVASPSWASRSPTNTGNQEDFYDCGALYEDVHRRFFGAPAAKPKYQALVVATGSPVNVTWQYLTPPGSDHAAANSGLYDATNGRYYALFGERTFSGRVAGTNGAKIIHFK